MKRFPVSRQLDQMDCGPACLKMVANHHKKEFSINYLRDLCNITRQGVNLSGINYAAETIGFRTLGAKITFEQLDEDAFLPCILHWNQNHFVVLPPQNYDRNKNRKITIADPAFGLVKVSKDLFLKNWVSSDNHRGIALLLEPTPAFYSNPEDRNSGKNFLFFLNYLKPYFKKTIPRIVIGMILASILSLIFPFLTQAMVDNGINQQNKGFIFLILMAQVALFIGNSVIEIIRARLMLHMNTRINIAIVSDFLFKLMKMPIRFFESKMIGDITQRINDHKRIEQFLTTTSLNVLFSFIVMSVYLIVLIAYSNTVFLIFLLGSAISLTWMLFFLRRRALLDYVRFNKMSDSQNNLFEIITGAQDIKLTNSETIHRWEWERIQGKLFKLNLKSLSLEQYQGIGSSLLTQLKNILITYFVAVEVVNGQMTMGEMLSVSYIIGQLNSPLDQLLNFLRGAQDARLSVERLREVQILKEEEGDSSFIPIDEERFVTNGTINLRNISFKYTGPESDYALKNINFEIPVGKITAIVGASGSGKSTLMKLLLKIYDPIEGQILVNNMPLQTLSTRWWRSKCGAVTQEGKIFSASIARNISLQENPDPEKLRAAVKVANIEDFINRLPLGFSTKIGNSGIGISSGQKQRLLIARAIFNNPHYILFDEATSFLDTNNEKIIIDNLKCVFEGKTVIVIAHRLSTVKSADNIVVLENGEIIETGDHVSLCLNKGKYYELIINQLAINS